MFSNYLTFLHILSFALLMACTTPSERVMNSGKAGDANSSVESHREIDGDSISRDDFKTLQLRENALRVYADRLAHDLKILPLPQKTLKSGDWELRLWNILGVEEEKLLVIIEDNGRHSAKFYTAVKEPEGPLRTTQQAIIPIEGWPAFVNFLNEQNINKHLFFLPDSIQTRAVIDENVILLEYKDLHHHRFAYFSQYTESPDGVRLMEVCSEVGNRFELDLSCKPKN